MNLINSIMKISDLINDINETTSGGIAIVAQPIGKVIKRPNPSVFAKTKTKENTKDEQLPHCELCKGKGCDACGGTGEEDGYIHRDLGEKGPDYDASDIHSTENKIKGMINYHQSEVDDAETDDSIMVDDHQNAIDWYEDLLQQHKETGADTFEAPFGGDTAWRENIQQEMEQLKLYKPQEAFRGIDNLPEELNDLRKRAGLEVKERYKDVGVADTVKDQRGKEFQFDKSTKKFKSLDGEEAAVNTKLGKDLLRLRRNQMKKSTPSYNR
jgi:hypothetical protein